jgi:hypothetical protein
MVMEIPPTGSQININRAIKWWIKTLQAAKIAGIISYVGEKNHLTFSMRASTISGKSDFGVKEVKSYGDEL